MSCRFAYKASIFGHQPQPKDTEMTKGKNSILQQVSISFPTIQDIVINVSYYAKVGTVIVRKLYQR